MPRKVTEILLIAEFEGELDEREVQAQLDAFREAVLPTINYEITFYRAAIGHAHLFDLSGRNGPDRIVPPRRFETEE